MLQHGVMGLKIDDALKNIAAIHQQHSIKCYLAIEFLKNKFDWSNTDWIEIEQLVNVEEPVFNVEILKDETVQFDTVPRRRHWVLSHAIYPHAYFTMQEWFENCKPTEIFNFYLAQCLESKQYLSHNVSILFAFEDAWSLIKTENQKLRFIERFCEFVTATFYGNNELAYQANDNFVPCKTLNLERLLIDCLSHPGFWGHNIIAFSSIYKRQDSLPEIVFNQLLSNLHEQCYWETEDEMDHSIIQISLQNSSLTSLRCDVSDENLELSCRHLLLNKKDNLHQITLTESVVFIFEQSWVTQSEKGKLIDVLEHFARC